LNARCSVKCARPRWASVSLSEPASTSRAQRGRAPWALIWIDDVAQAVGSVPKARGRIGLEVAPSCGKGIAPRSAAAQEKDKPRPERCAGRGWGLFSWGYLAGLWFGRKFGLGRSGRRCGRRRGYKTETSHTRCGSVVRRRSACLHRALEKTGANTNRASKLAGLQVGDKTCAFINDVVFRDGC